MICVLACGVASATQTNHPKSSMTDRTSYVSGSSFSSLFFAFLNHVICVSSFFTGNAAQHYPREACWKLLTGRLVQDRGMATLRESTHYSDLIGSPAEAAFGAEYREDHEVDEDDCIDEIDKSPAEYGNRTYVR